MSGKSDLALFGGKPLFSLERHTRWPIITDDERRAVTAVLDRGILSGPFAPEALAFQEEFAEYVGARYALLTHSGTSALVIALAAAGVRDGDEVLVPAYTFVATPLSVVQLGAVPVFVDVKADTGNMDPTLIEAEITGRTKAIMPVHVHGCPADLDEIGAIAKTHNLEVVEDAAQAHGATYSGKPVGALYCGGGFSLQSSKNLPAGEGGVYVTNDGACADAANALRNFGQDLRVDEAKYFDPKRPLDGHRSLDSKRVGAMFRGSEMMAAFARAQLQRLPEMTARCQDNAQVLIDRLAELPGVTPPTIPSGRTTVHHKFRVRLEAEQAGLDPRALGGTGLRDAVLAALCAEGIEAGMWESAPQPRQSVFATHEGAPWRDLADSVAANYEAPYPVAQRLLDTSLVLFSHSAPLIAQERGAVEAYADAFEKVWKHREALATRD